jgi:tripartite-type tricarboxylate transporter receptor subunit TctC
MLRLEAADAERARCAGGRLHAAFRRSGERNQRYNFIRDIAPVAGIVREPNVMVANPSVPAKTVPDFIAYAKANPRKVNMASSYSG